MTVILWYRGPCGELCVIVDAVRVLPGFVLLGVSVLTDAQLGVAYEIVDALGVEAEKALLAA